MKIAIVGKMCAGKSSLSKYIQQYVRNIGGTTEALSFSSAIYDIARNYFGMEQKNRKLLQQIGTKLKEIDTNIWVDVCMRQAKRSKALFVIIEDIRFENELQAAKKNGFFIIKINIGKELQLQRLKNTYEDWEKHVENLDHESETRLDSFSDSDFDLILDAKSEAIEDRSDYFKLLNAFFDSADRK